MPVWSILVPRWAFIVFPTELFNRNHKGWHELDGTHLTMGRHYGKSLMASQYQEFMWKASSSCNHRRRGYQWWWWHLWAWVRSWCRVQYGVRGGWSGPVGEHDGMILCCFAPCYMQYINMSSHCSISDSNPSISIQDSCFSELCSLSLRMTWFESQNDMVWVSEWCGLSLRMMWFESQNDVVWVSEWHGLSLRMIWFESQNHVFESQNYVVWVLESYVWVCKGNNY